MRPLETLLLAALILALPALSASWLPSAGWVRYLAVAPALIALVQARAEGARWQLAPAYLLAGLFLLVCLVRTAAPDIAVPAWTSRVAAGLGALWLSVAAALPALLPVFRFPPPGGPHAVGTVTLHWVDEDRPERLAADTQKRRELMVQIWYPASAAPTLPRAPYVEGEILGPVLRLLRMPAFMLSHLKYVHTNARASAPVAEGEPRYPVLLFSHGRGGFRGHNTRLVEELASYGYVVAAIDHPYAATGVFFPDGRLVSMHPRMADREFVDAAIPYLVQDARFTLRQLDVLNEADPLLAGRLDLDRVGIFGVSLGGEVSAEACRVEPRLQACLVMDVWMPRDVLQEGLTQPTMFITRDAETMRREGWPEDVVEETLGTMRSVYDRLPGDGYFVRVPGMFHNDFSDAPMFTPLTRWLGATGPMPAHRKHAIMNAYTLAFFDRHLKGQTAPLLDGPAKQYPEVLFEMRNGA